MFLTVNDIDRILKPIGGGNKPTIARYPLTNLGTDDDDMLYIEIAIAGFAKEDIGIELKGNQLHIKGAKSNEAEDTAKPKINYIQEHISSVEFERIIVLHENYVGGDIEASVINGILTVTVKPKEQTRKLITIS